MFKENTTPVISEKKFQTSFQDFFGIHTPLTLDTTLHHDHSHIILSITCIHV